MYETYKSSSAFGRPEQTMWDLWWTKWHWNSFFPRLLQFTLSVATHQICLHAHSSRRSYKLSN